MLPYCALNPKFVYQSAQFDRFSDQFFIVPRAVADSWFMAILEFQRQGWVNCKGGKNGAIKSMRRSGVPAPQPKRLLSQPTSKSRRAQAAPRPTTFSRRARSATSRWSAASTTGNSPGPTCLRTFDGKWQR